jgi:hypothetical protein
MAVKKTTRKRRRRLRPSPQSPAPPRQLGFIAFDQVDEDFWHTGSGQMGQPRHVPERPIPSPSASSNSKHNPQSSGRPLEYPVKLYEFIARELAADAIKRGEIDKSLALFAGRVEMRAERVGLEIPPRIDKLTSSRQMQNYVARIYYETKAKIDSR